MSGRKRQKTKQSKSSSQENRANKTDEQILEEFTEYLAGDFKIAESSRKTYISRVVLFKRWMEDSGSSLTDLTQTDLLDFKSYVYRKYRTSTANGYLIAVRKFCKFLIEKEYNNFDVSQADKVMNLFGETLPFAPKSLNATEINAVRRASDMLGNIKYNIVIELGLCAGLRVEEMASLRFEDITLYKQTGKLHIRGKGFKQRDVNISKRLAVYLRQFFDSVQEENQKGYIFPGKFVGQHANRITLWNWIKHVGKLADVKLHPHMLRHTFCTELVRKGESVALVQKLAGHKDIKTTIRYIQPSEEDLEKAVKDL